MPSPVPPGLHTLTPQLTVEGAAEAIAFYAAAFGAVETMRAPDPSGEKIWHAELRFGDSLIFLNDAFPEMGGPAHPTRLWLYTAGVDAAFERAVAAGCVVKMPLMDMFWGDRTGMLSDKWGNVWVLAERTRELSPQQMRAEEDALKTQWSKGQGKE
jgi:uncharacterized glyoxalase superfamily protein PhnB